MLYLKNIEIRAKNLSGAWLVVSMTTLWQRLSSGFYKLKSGFCSSAHFFLPIAKFTCLLVWSTSIFVKRTNFYNSRIPSARTVLSCSFQEIVVRCLKIGVRVTFLNKIGTYYYRCSIYTCLLYTSPSPRDATLSRMPSSA